MSQVDTLSVRTVIIGAGIAGIGASINFLSNNYEDFVVFEAIERIGGRFHTLNNEGGYLEIGAQWIHGQAGNPLFEVARKHNLLLDGFDRIQPESEKTRTLENKDLIRLSSINKDNIFQTVSITDPEKVIFPTQNGKKVNSHFAQGIYDLVTKIITMAETHKIDISNPVDDRVGDFLFDKFNEIVDAELANYDATKTGLSTSELKKTLYGIFLMRCRRENIRSGGNPFDLSLRNFSTYKEFGGYSYVELKKGFGPIVDAIISEHKDKFYSRVRLNHYLKKIYLCSKLSEPSSAYPRPCSHCKYTSDKNKAVLVICNRTNPKEPKDLVVICDHVISTMSLGYLKENVNGFLEPLNFLSQEKRTAIARLGFGTINKIFLFYEKPFWGENIELMNMIWVPEDEKQFRVDKLKHENDVTPMWQEQICKFEVVRSQSGRNCLSAWIAGSEYFEKLDDATIGKECTKLLRRFLANDSIPEPSSLLRTKWNSHKFVRGSYSCLPLGSSPKDFEILAKPIPSENNPILMFAGEATNPDYFSTMHGAYLTGLRESNRLLKLQKAKI